MTAASADAEVTSQRPSAEAADEMLSADADLPIVAIYGNCQVDYLRLLIKFIPALADRFAFVVVANHGRNRPVPPMPPELARSAVLWEQHDASARVDMREAMRAAVPEYVPVVRFPALSLTAFWPFACLDTRPGAARADRFPWGDRIAIEIAQEGFVGPHALDEYMRRSRERMPNVDRMLANDRALAQSRDAACMVTMSDLVFQDVRSQRRFSTWGHAVGTLIAALLERIVAVSPAVDTAVIEEVRRQTATAVAIAPRQTSGELPIHPLVIDRLALTFVNSESTYPWYGNAWTFETYMQRYMALDPAW